MGCHSVGQHVGDRDRLEQDCELDHGQRTAALFFVHVRNNVRQLHAHELVNLVQTFACKVYRHFSPKCGVNSQPQPQVHHGQCGSGTMPQVRLNQPALSKLAEFLKQCMERSVDSSRGGISNVFVKIINVSRPCFVIVAVVRRSTALAAARVHDRLACTTPNQLAQLAPKARVRVRDGKFCLAFPERQRVCLASNPAARQSCFADFASSCVGKFELCLCFNVLQRDKNVIEFWSHLQTCVHVRERVV